MLIITANSFMTIEHNLFSAFMIFSCVCVCVCVCVTEWERGREMSFRSSPQGGVT